jgi:hypothetical protein
VINSDTPQEVEAGKEIIFTYDVGFEVIFLLFIFSFVSLLMNTIF